MHNDKIKQAARAFIHGEQRYIHGIDIDKTGICIDNHKIIKRDNEKVFFQLPALDHYKSRNIINELLTLTKGGRIVCNNQQPIFDGIALQLGKWYRVV